MAKNWGLQLIASDELRPPKNLGLNPSLVKSLDCSLMKVLSQSQLVKQIPQLIHSNWSQFILSLYILKHFHLIHLEIVTKEFWDSCESSSPSPSVGRIPLPYLNIFFLARMPQNDVVPFSVYHMISICLIVDDANFDHLIVVLYSRFCYY